MSTLRAIGIYFHINKSCCFGSGLICAILFGVSFFIICVIMGILSTVGCPGVNSCNYNIIETDTKPPIYLYYYVINNITSCSNYCRNPLEFDSCPLNYTKCDVTGEVKDFCKYQGFKQLFSTCDRTKYDILSFTFAGLVGLAAICGIICCCLLRNIRDQEQI